MARIEAEATRMGVLVENLLLLARLDELPEMRLVPVDLRELAEHAAQDTRALLPTGRFRLTVNGAVRVLGDPEQLGQVLSNLTRNAVIHTPPGTAIEITVAAEGERALIEVRDHGPGLPPDAGDQVFERFWRTEGGRSRGRGGAGLGLAIVKAIVQDPAAAEVHQADNAPRLRCGVPGDPADHGTRAPDRGRLGERRRCRKARRTGPVEPVSGTSQHPRGWVSGRRAKVFA